MVTSFILSMLFSDYPFIKEQRKRCQVELSYNRERSTQDFPNFKKIKRNLEFFTLNGNAMFRFYANPDKEPIVSAPCETRISRIHCDTGAFYTGFEEMTQVQLDFYKTGKVHGFFGIIDQNNSIVNMEVTGKCAVDF